MPLRWPLAFASLLTACSSPPLADPRPTPTRAEVPPPRSPPPPAPTPIEAAPRTQAAEPLPAFAPGPFPAPHARSARPGDGEVTPLVRAADGSMLLGVTTLRPHPVKASVRVVMVALDLARIELSLMGGHEPPRDGEVEKSTRTGLVPLDELPRTLAVFNGGWLSRHGNHGSTVRDDTLLPPREGLCTLLLDQEGRPRVATWPPGAEVVAAAARGHRQGPPCLLEAGKPHPDLKSRPGRWGLSAEGKVDIRRSAFGLGPDPRIGWYALGEWLSPHELMLALAHVGVTDAIELDVNWSYTRFLLVGRVGPPDAAGRDAWDLTGELVKDTKRARGEYVRRPSARDFFYVTLRESIPRFP